MSLDASTGPVRKSPRMAVNIPARLVVRGHTHDVLVQNISRHGAFIIQLPELDRGTPAELQLDAQGPRPLRIPATVVYWSECPPGSHDRDAPGAGLRFATPFEDDDARFGAAITCLLVQQTFTTRQPHRTRLTRPTEPIPESEKIALAHSMNVASEGRLVFAGHLEVVGVPEILTTLAARRISGRLDLRNDGIIAAIDLVQGDIVDFRATITANEPRTIIWMVLSWRTGTFRLVASVPTDPTQGRIKVSSLLLQHLRARPLPPASAR